MNENFITYRLPNRALTNEEERDLATRWQAGDKAAGDKLVLYNARGALMIAARYTTMTNDKDELYQLAMCGLYRALQRFDPDRGFRFLTYAGAWIRNYIGRGLKEAKETVHVPQYKFDDGHRVRISSLDLPAYSDEDSTTRADMLLATHGSPEQIQRELELDELHQVLFNATRFLDPRSRDIIRSRWLDPHGATLEEMAQVHGVSRERIRQIENKALRFIKGYLVRLGDLGDVLDMAGCDVPQEENMKESRLTEEQVRNFVRSWIEEDPELVLDSAEIINKLEVEPHVLGNRLEQVVIDELVAIRQEWTEEGHLIKRTRELKKTMMLNMCRRASKDKIPPPTNLVLAERAQQVFGSSYWDSQMAKDRASLAGQVDFPLKNSGGAGPGSSLRPTKAAAKPESQPEIFYLRPGGPIVLRAVYAPDPDTYSAMREVWRVCEKASIAIPVKVRNYFARIGHTGTAVPPTQFAFTLLAEYQVGSMLDVKKLRFPRGTTHVVAVPGRKQS